MQVKLTSRIKSYEPCRYYRHKKNGQNCQLQNLVTLRTHLKILIELRPDYQSFILLHFITRLLSGILRHKMKVGRNLRGIQIARVKLKSNVYFTIQYCSWVGTVGFGLKRLRLLGLKSGLLPLLGLRLVNKGSSSRSVF